MQGVLRTDVRQWWIDHASRVLVRGSVAIPLTILELTIFLLLSRTMGAVNSREIIEHLYSGVADPPLYPREALRIAIFHMNPKLERAGLFLRGVNRRHRSTYELIDRWEKTLPTAAMNSHGLPRPQASR
jgi:DNA-binding response OmpR family regulator